MENRMNANLIQIDPASYRIEDGGVRFFVLTGSRQALLVDSGMNVHNAKEIVQEVIGDLPLKLLNTHADIDHIGSNREFAFTYMNPAEGVNYRNPKGELAAIEPVWDGDILDLGGRVLTVIAMPGHTPGSIALLDEERRVLISGDPIQDGEIFLFGPMRHLEAYKLSLERLWERYQDRFDFVWASHGTFPISKDVIPKLIEGVKRLKNGEFTPKKAAFMNTAISEYDIGPARLLLDP